MAMAENKTESEGDWGKEGLVGEVGIDVMWSPPNTTDSPNAHPYNFQKTARPNENI